MKLPRPGRFRALLLAAPLLLALAASNPRPAPSQAEFDALARDTGVRYAIVDNSPANRPAGADGTFLTTLTLTMPKQIPAGIEGFALYFSFTNRLPLVESEVFRSEWINGDLNRLILKPGAALEPGKTYVVKLWGAGHHHSTAFVMPNLYIAGTGVEARVLEATRPKIDPETGHEILPFVAPMTDEARLAGSGAEDKTQWQTPERAFEAFAARGEATVPEFAMVPSPVSATHLSGPAIDLRGGVTLRLTGVTRAQLAPALKGLGFPTAKGPVLDIQLYPEAKFSAPEAFRLTAQKGRIEILAADLAGVNYALRALAQQAAFDKGRLRPLLVDDAPRYPFRGLHIDLARNFHSKAEILKLIDAMAAYRFNKLHLHLADDEGWRLEIKALPELTEVGSRRCHDPEENRCLLPQLGAGPEGTGPVNGYLSQADYVEIVRAATLRNIEVIPSLDMPGHSRAAIRSMEVRYRRLNAAGKTAEAEAYRLVEPADTTKYLSIQNYTDNTLNVCIPQTYRFLDTAVGEIAAMHAAAGAPLKVFHIGADETAGAWGDSPACKPLMASTGRTAKALGAYFIERVAGMLAEKGLKVAGWSDGLGHTDPAKMPKSVQTNIWGTLFWGGIAETHTQANQGWDVVLSIPDIGYLDMPYVPHPLERGYDWASRSVDTLQIFGFMTDNLPANAALIRDTFARPQTIDDKTPRAAGRGIAGLQAQLWSETIRTDAGVDYQFFPRLLAFAERAWHRPDWEPAYVPGQSYVFEDRRVDRAAILADWRGFAGRMPVQFGMLDRLGVAYRVTPPGAKIWRGMLVANAEYPGMAIEYRVAGGKWQRYAHPFPARGVVELRTRSADGKRASRTVTVGRSSQPGG